VEWRLFPRFTVPPWCRPEFFADHPWIDPAAQRGHAERTNMVADLVVEVAREHDVQAVTDLGCGDGALLAKIRRRNPRLRTWGYDLGRENLYVATALREVDARLGNILTTEGLELGDLLVASEVVEHLYDPRGFITGLPGKLLVLSSPFDEDDQQHYEHHAWAWDEPGYVELVEACGWTVKEQRRCDAGFQTVLAVRS
jgi:trans-aconitate methyltransferase